MIGTRVRKLLSAYTIGHSTNEVFGIPGLNNALSVNLNAFCLYLKKNSSSMQAFGICVMRLQLNVNFDLNSVFIKL